MWVTVIPIVAGALGTVPEDSEKGLKELEIRGRIEAIQITALLRSDRILRAIQDTRSKTCCHSASSERPSANAGVRNTQGEK